MISSPILRKTSNSTRIHTIRSGPPCPTPAPCVSRHAAPRARLAAAAEHHRKADTAKLSACRTPRSTGHSPSSSSQHSRPTSQSISGSLPTSHEGSLDCVGPSLAVRLEGGLTSPPQSSASVSSGTSASGPGRSHGTSIDDDAGEEPLITFRFEHREDDNDHHVVIGREGKLSRCEDEVRMSTFSVCCRRRVVTRDSFIVPLRAAHQPIRTPGAVQGFGVLVVVQQNSEEYQLLVRQVSENSTELLGLSPHYLFSLSCFTDVLPDSQATILWDNIQYLADLDEDSPSECDSPHVFLLGGWGMPGSALLSADHEEPHDRRAWSCWCAAHRPKMAAGTTSSGVQDLNILEFELEHDVFNPLYPVPRGRNVGLFSGLSSPGDNDSASACSTGTSRTLVSSITSPQDLGGPSPSESSLMPLSVSGLSIQANPQALPGVEGDDRWVPSAEDILESTTNYAKPLAALERIRKLNQGRSQGLSTE